MVGVRTSKGRQREHLLSKVRSLKEVRLFFVHFINYILHCFCQMLNRSWGRTLRTIFTRGVCCSFIQEEYLITFFFSDRVLLRATEVRCLIKVLWYLCLKTQLHSKCDNRNHRSDPKEIQVDKLP